MNGKGSKQRPTDLKRYGQGWDRVFKAKHFEYCSKCGYFIFNTSWGKDRTLCDICKTGNNQNERNEMNLINHINRQKQWSTKTFGPGSRTEGVIDHIKKELEEIKNDPDDLEEWVDVILLAIDGAWRSGHNEYEICKAIQQKQEKNEKRSWPDWRSAPIGKAIEHLAKPVKNE